MRQLLSSRRFGSLGRKLVTHRRSQDFGENFRNSFESLWKRNCLRKKEVCGAGSEIWGACGGNGLIVGAKSAGKLFFFGGGGEAFFCLQSAGEEDRGSLLFFARHSGEGGGREGNSCKVATGPDFWGEKGRSKFIHDR